jgi:hypothetical protein
MSNASTQRISCQWCADLDPDDESSVQSPINAIWTSAGSGCESCALIRDAVIECAPEAVVESKNCVVVRKSILRHFVELVVLTEEPKDSIVLDLFVTAGAIPHFPWNFCILTHDSDTFCPWRNIRIGVETSGNTISLTSFRNVEKWLTNCLQEHDSCRAGPIPLLPSRVLDLRANEPDLVLCEPRQKRAGYVCLSHCWGDARGITTTIANLEAFKSGITFQGLPRTFQEAIIFTRKLGIQYLWIDSL